MKFQQHHHSNSMPSLAYDDDNSSATSIGSSADSEDSRSGETQHRSRMVHANTTLDLHAECDEPKTTAVPPHTGYKKVLVTGGAGFIGSHVAEFLLARGDDVVIVDEINDYYDVKIKQANLRLLRLAYPDEKRLKFQFCKLDTLFHLSILKFLLYLL